MNFHVLNGFFYVANFLAITVPCATVIMLVDHFLLPRLFGISRPLTRVPPGTRRARSTSPRFWPASPRSGTARTPPTCSRSSARTLIGYWGPAPLEAWLLAGGFYVAGVALCRRLAPASVEALLGFDVHARGQDVPPQSVVDVASAPGVA